MLDPFGGRPSHLRNSVQHEQRQELEVLLTNSDLSSLTAHSHHALTYGQGISACTSWMATSGKPPEVFGSVWS